MRDLAIPQILSPKNSIDYLYGYHYHITVYHMATTIVTIMAEYINFTTPN